MNLKIQKIFIITILLILAAKFSTAQNSVSANTANAIRKGNATELAKNFDNNIQLKIGTKNNVYSKTQAEKILSNFFEQHIPQNFKIESEKLRGDATVVLGILNTQNSKFRIIYRIVPDNNKTTLTYLEIESF